VMRGHTVASVHDMRSSTSASLIAAIAALESERNDEDQGAAA
jgi:hypothetical protein